MWAALLLAASAAAAEGPDALFEETELMFIGEDLFTVTIASRKAEPLRRAPAAVTVLGPDELRHYRTLADALRQVPGFFIDRTELKERIYLRGIPDSFLVMMDGVPFSSDASTRDYPRGLDLSLEYIEKIEIIRGPGSALWGPDAFSGIINLVPRQGASLQGAALMAEQGSFDTGRVAGQAGFNRHGWDAFVFGATARSEGFEDDLPNDRQRHDDRVGEVYARLSYRDLFEISGRFSDYTDYYSEPSFLLQGAEEKSFSFVQTTLSKSFERSSVSLQGWFQYFENRDDYDTSGYRQFNRQYGLEGKYDVSLLSSHVSTFGMSFRYNQGSSTRFVSRGTSLSYFPDYDTRLFSCYFQDKWSLSDNLEATVGLRYDNHSEYESFVSPRFGVSYQFFDYFTLKLLYGRAFRTPSLVSLIEESGLDPERIDSYEAELGFHYRNRLNFTLNYFYNELDDLIQRDAFGAIANRRKENIKGIEAAVRWRVTDQVSLYGNVSHLFGDRQQGTRGTQDPDEGGTTIESFYNVGPDNMGNLGGSYTPWPWLTVSLEMNWVDARRLSRVVSTPGGRKRLGSYALFDLYVAVRDLPLRNMDLTATWKNIFDRDYTTRGVFGLVDGQESAVYVSLRYRF